MIRLALDIPRLTWDAMVISVRSLDSLQSARTVLVTLTLIPLFQVLYLTSIGATNSQDPHVIAEVAVSSCMLLAAVAAVESTAGMLTSDRNSGTLSAVMMSSLPRPVVWAGRAAVATATGLLVGVVGMSVASLLVTAGDILRNLPVLLLVLAVTSISCSGMSFAIGALGLRFRDSYLPANLATSALIILSGAVAPLSSTPEALRVIAHAIPITYCVEAARVVLAADTAGRFGLLLGSAAAVGGLWFVAGCLLWTWLERRARRNNSFELF